MNHVVVYRKIQPKHLDLLRQHCRVSYYPDVHDENRNEFFNDLQTADALLGAAMKITSEMLDQAPNLRVVSNFSAGYDNLDLDLLTSRGIIVTNAPDALTDTVADLYFASILATARKVAELDSLIRSGKWTNSIGEEQFGIDVHHRKIGIIGLGRIGRAIAKRAALGFDMSVYYTKRNRDLEAEEKYRATHCEDLSELLKVSDFICITVPLTAETRHMISHHEFKLMKSTAIIVNGSRGPVIDEPALVQALQNGEILGAGLDVFANEPLEADSPLLTMKNVVLTPHIGSATLATRSLMVEHGIENMFTALKGEKPPNILNEEVLIRK